MRDIENRRDIMLLVDSFYEKVLKDEIIGFIFTDIAKINVKHHMPKMYDFWETTLFNKAIYKGNPMRIHMEMNDKVPMKKEHFLRWIELFNSTVDGLFSGTKAALAKTRALSISTVMQIKIVQQHS